MDMKTALTALGSGPGQVTSLTYVHGAFWHVMYDVPEDRYANMDLKHLEGDLRAKGCNVIPSTFTSAVSLDVDGEALHVEVRPCFVHEDGLDARDIDDLFKFASYMEDLGFKPSDYSLLWYPDRVFVYITAPDRELEPLEVSAMIAEHGKWRFGGRKVSYSFNDRPWRPDSPATVFPEQDSLAAYTWYRSLTLDLVRVLRRKEGRGDAEPVDVDLSTAVLEEKVGLLRYVLRALNREGIAVEGVETLFDKGFLISVDPEKTFIVQPTLEHIGWQRVPSLYDDAMVGVYAGKLYVVRSTPLHISTGSLGDSAVDAMLYVGEHLLPRLGLSWEQVRICVATGDIEVLLPSGLGWPDDKWRSLNDHLAEKVVGLMVNGSARFRDWDITFERLEQDAIGLDSGIPEVERDSVLAAAWWESLADRAKNRLLRYEEAGGS